MREIVPVLGLLAFARLANADFSLSTGFDYSSGKYGATEETTITYLPVTVKFEAARYFLRLTIPYLRIDAPSGGAVISVGPDGQPIRAATGARETQEGMGDIIAAGNYTLVRTDGGFFLDLLGKIKSGTADETKGLGTGENDYSAQLDATQALGQLAILGTLGYRVYGDPPGTDFDNAFFASLGAVYKLTPKASAGLFHDFRENIVRGTHPQRDLTAFVSYKAAKNRKFQGYVYTGLSDSSADRGMGLIAIFAF